MCVGPKRVTTGRSKAAAKCRGLLAVRRARTAGLLGEAIVRIDDGARNELTARVTHGLECIGQQCGATITGIADAPARAAQPGHECRAEAIGKQDSNIDSAAAQL